jgi:hypothetical protein
VTAIRDSTTQPTVKQRPIGVEDAFYGRLLRKGLVEVSLLRSVPYYFGTLPKRSIDARYGWTQASESNTAIA